MGVAPIERISNKFAAILHLLDKLQDENQSLKRKIYSLELSVDQGKIALEIANKSVESQAGTELPPNSQTDWSTEKIAIKERVQQLIAIIDSYSTDQSSSKK
ncbi:MAG: hypothetical protein ACN4E2_07340 [Nitrospinota bacterium]